MKKLTLVLNIFLIINSIFASGKKPENIWGKWYLKSIVIDGISRSPAENISPYIYFGYDSSNRFSHRGSFYQVDGKYKFSESYHFENFYQLEDDSVRLVGPRLKGHRGIKGATFDLRNELHGAFKYRISNNKLLLENKKISLAYEKDSVINHGLEKAANSPDFGFDKKLIGRWRLVKMNVPDYLVAEVNNSIEEAYKLKRNHGYPQKKRPKKLIEMGKQEVSEFLQNGGWFVNIGNFVEKAGSYDTLSYGNFIGFSDGCNGCRGYIKISGDTLKTYGIMCTSMGCFPNFTETFKNQRAFDNATYNFKSDTLVIEAEDRTSYFVSSEPIQSAKKYDHQDLDKFYQLKDLDIENKDLEEVILQLLPDNEIYFHLNSGSGVNPKDFDCRGKYMRIYLFNKENYYMNELMSVIYENVEESQERFNYNCTFVRKEHPINEYLDFEKLLGKHYILKIEGKHLTFHSPDNRNILYLKSNY